MTRKNETQHWIREKGREKFSDTKPERFVKALLTDMRRSYLHGDAENPLHVKTTYDQGLGTAVKSEIDLHPDFILTNINPAVIVEVDGPYHQTEIQARKGRWRDTLLTEQGYRVIHIDDRLCVPAWKSVLKHTLHQAIESKKSVVRIEA